MEKQSLHKKNVRGSARIEKELHESLETLKDDAQEIISNIKSAYDKELLIREEEMTRWERIKHKCISEFLGQFCKGYSQKKKVK